MDTLNPSPSALVSYGSDYLAALMREIGLEYVALNPGASFRGLHDSLVNSLGDERPQMLTVLHEEHAVAIAHGYAKVAGKPMGAILHANVGLLHGSMAIFDAFCDRVPVMVFGATGPVDAAKRRPWIDWLHTSKDQGALIRSFVKWDAEPASLEAAREAVLRANQIATTYPQGPTYVCFDSALQERKFDVLPALPDVKRYTPPAPAVPAPEDIQNLAKRIRGARKPVFLFGRVSRDQDDWDRRVALAETCGAMVLTDFKLGAAFPTDHPLHAVAPSFFLGPDALELLADSDLIVSFDWADLGGALKGAWPGKEPAAFIAHASMDQVLHNGFGMEHQSLPAADLYLQCAANQLVDRLLKALPSSGERAFMEPRATGALDEISDAPGGMPMARFAAEVASCLDLNRPVTLMRANLGWPSSAWALQEPLDYLGYDGGGGIGSGPGMAVGAALALRTSNRLPVAVLGDGDFLMGGTAFWTAVRYKIPLLVVIANNRSFFNDEVHQEAVAIHRSRPVENKWIGQRIEGPDVDLAGFARSLGAQAWGPVESAEELRSALGEAVAAVRAGHVAIVDVRVAREYAPAMASALKR